VKVITSIVFVILATGIASGQGLRKEKEYRLIPFDLDGRKMYLLPVNSAGKQELFVEFCWLKGKEVIITALPAGKIKIKNDGKRFFPTVEFIRKESGVPETLGETEDVAFAIIRFPSRK